MFDNSYMKRVVIVSEKIKLVLIYLFTLIVTIIISIVFSHKSISTIGLISMLLFNIALFILLVKYMNISKDLISKFLFIIFLLFIPLIIDIDYFVLSYTQSTPILIFPDIVLFILNVILIPFIYIFEILFNLGVSEFSFIIIPLFLYILYIVIKKIL